MYSTTVNYFVQRQTVVLYSGSSNRRYDIVYAKNLTLNKGVSNKIQFEFLNQDQKPINITGKNISFRLIKYDRSVIYIRKQLSELLPLKGLAVLEIDPMDMLSIEPQLCYYSLDIDDGSGTYPVYVSPDANASGVVNVIDSVFPRYMNSVNIEIPTHPSPAAPGITFRSSALSMIDNPIFSDLFSIQMKLTNFTGNIVVQGSTTNSTDWYDINNVTSYSGSSDTVWFSLEGYHPYVRVTFSNVTTGDVSNIIIR